jgi:hypothetical protein
MMTTARQPVVFDPEYLKQGRAVASELMSALPHLHNLRELSVERPSNDGCPQFISFCTAVAIVGPRLTRLRLEKIRMSDAETVVTSVSPWSQFLRHLVLHIEGSSHGGGGNERVLDCLVHRLIAPARKTLEDLEIHVYMPELQSFTPTNTSSQEKWISTMFIALAEVQFPRLRGLSVRTPFCSEPTQSEGAPLAHLIETHALEQLDVGIARVTSVHSSAVDPTAEYYRFLSLLTPIHGTCLRKLSLHTPKPRQHGQGIDPGLSVISDFMSSVRVPLAGLAIHGVALQAEEWTRIIGVAPTFAGTLCSLYLPMATVTPGTLMAIASALPSLQVLDIKTPELRGTTRRVQVTVSNNSAADRRAVNAHRAKWVQESALDFLHDIQIQQCWHLSLRRLRIQVLQIFAADLDCLDILQPVLPAFGRAVPTLSEAIIEAVGALQFWREATIGLGMS